MKKLFSLVVLALLLVSCNKAGDADFLNSPEGMTKLEETLVSQFGKDCAYQRIMVEKTNMGDMVVVECTKDASTPKLEGWTYVPGSGWEQKSEISVDIPEGTTLADFVYVLGKELTLAKVTDVIEASRKTIVDEGKLGNEIVARSLIIKTNNTTKDDLNFTVFVEPKNGGTSTQFAYDKEFKEYFRK